MIHLFLLCLYSMRIASRLTFEAFHRSDVLAGQKPLSRGLKIPLEVDSTDCHMTRILPSCVSLYPKNTVADRAQIVSKPLKARSSRCRILKGGGGCLDLRPLEKGQQQPQTGRMWLILLHAGCICMSWSYYPPCSHDRLVVQYRDSLVTRLRALLEVPYNRRTSVGLDAQGS